MVRRFRARGFLFGFDTVIISGAEETIQSLWGLIPGIHGLAMGAALWGTVLGSFLGSLPPDRFGRGKTLLCIGILFLMGSFLVAIRPRGFLAHGVRLEITDDAIEHKGQRRGLAALLQIRRHAAYARHEETPEQEEDDLCVF